MSTISRSISIIERLTRMYYNHALEGCGTGWGQQFYVEYLYDHPGASAQEMAQHIRVDKATLTKVIQRLSQIGFLRVEPDGAGRRVKRLYLTERALPAARRIKEVHGAFFEDMSMDIPPEDLKRTEEVLRKMMENIRRCRQ